MDAPHQLARCEYVDRRENVIAVGNRGTGKTHVALGLGLAACQRGLSVGFTTAASLVHELIEARDERRLHTLQLLPGPELHSYAGAVVEVLEGLDGRLSVRHEGGILASQLAAPLGHHLIPWQPDRVGQPAA